MSDKKFEILVKKYNSRIKSVIRTFTGSENEDIEQEVYIKTWKNISNYKEEGKVGGWIKTITLNTCKDYFKSKQFRQNKLHEPEDAIFLVKDTKFSPEKRLLMTERQKKILEAINSLKPKFKEIIILFDIKEFSYEEISSQLGCPIGTVKSRLFNARKILQEELKEFI